MGRPKISMPYIPIDSFLHHVLGNFFATYFVDTNFSIFLFNSGVSRYVSLHNILISCPFCNTHDSRSTNTRLWTPLRATGDIYDDNTNSTSTNKQRKQADANSFERLVRSVTRNDEYKFGGEC